MTTGLACPRCGTADGQVVHRSSPPTDAWEVVHCRSCSFTWRTTEEPEVIDPERRPAVFSLQPPLGQQP